MPGNFRMRKLFELRLLLHVVNMPNLVGMWIDMNMNGMASVSTGLATMRGLDWQLAVNPCHNKPIRSSGFYWMVEVLVNCLCLYKICWQGWNFYDMSMKGFLKRAQTIALRHFKINTCLFSYNSVCGKGADIASYRTRS